MRSGKTFAAFAAKADRYQRNRRERHGRRPWLSRVRARITVIGVLEVGTISQVRSLGEGFERSRMFRKQDRFFGKLGTNLSSAVSGVRNLSVGAFEIIDPIGLMGTRWEPRTKDPTLAESATEPGEQRSTGSASAGS